MGRGGRALRTSGRECVAQGRGLKGNRASRKAQRGTRTARGATDFLQSASLPASAGPAVLVQPESVRAEAGSLARIVRVAGAALFWLLGGQAEEGGEQGRVGLPDQRPDKLWGPAHDRGRSGGQRPTSRRWLGASVSGARTGDALAGGASGTCLPRLSRRFSRSVGQRSRREASRSALGGSAALILAARWGCAGARGRPERSGVERSEKPASQAPWEAAKCRELARWLATT